MDVQGSGVKVTFTDRVASFGDRWWPVLLVAFGAFAFLGVLPHHYTYHY